MGQLLCQLFLLFLTAFCLGTATPVMAQSELSGQVPSQVDKPENDSVLGVNDHGISAGGHWRPLWSKRCAGTEAQVS